MNSLHTGRSSIVPQILIGLTNKKKIIKKNKKLETDMGISAERLEKQNSQTRERLLTSPESSA